MKTSHTYSDRVQRVVAYVAEHLDDKLDIESLSRVANFSPYHFHRVYRGLLGETLHDTVRRLRLRRAAIDLLDRAFTVERTASRAGYSSQAAFTRAFRAEYGQPPARYRGARRKTSFDDETAGAYDVQFVELAPLRVAAIEHVGDYSLTSQAFERLTTFAATTGLLSNTTRTIGIYHDDPLVVPAADLRSTACMTIPENWTPSGDLMEGRIQGGRYAQIVHTGPYDQLSQAYDWLYRIWLPTSGEEPRDLPCLEEYLNNPREVPAKECRTALMIPLEG